MPKIVVKKVKKAVKGFVFPFTDHKVSVFSVVDENFSTPNKTKSNDVASCSLNFECLPLPVEINSSDTLKNAELSNLPDKIATMVDDNYNNLCENDGDEVNLMTLPDPSPSKHLYDRDNWTCSRTTTVLSTGGGWVPPFSFYPLELKSESERTSRKTGAPSMDSCECFVGFYNSNDNTGLCPSIAVGMCVECFNDIFYCSKCVSHVAHTTIAEEVAIAMSMGNNKK
jgi:hypothetical protein